LDISDELHLTEKVVNGTVIIDDFAHHPTEIIATLDAARQKYPSKEIVALDITSSHKDIDSIVMV